MGGKKGFGTKLEYRTSTGPDVWVVVAGITKLRPFAKKADVVDMSSHDSPSETREKEPGMIDAGELQADLNFRDIDTGHIWLENNVGVAGQAFRITYPGTAPTKTRRAFAGFVQSFQPDSPFDSKLTGSVVIAISGPLTASTDGS
jgi:hypothetical protein